MAIAERKAAKPSVAKRSRKTRPQRPGSPSSIFGVSPTLSSVNVTHDTALTYSALYRAINIVAGCIASLPIRLYRRSVRGAREVREVVTDHPVAILLSRRPNDEQTPMLFKESIASGMCRWGNGYAEIERSIGGEIQNLWPIDPSSVRVTREDQVGVRGPVRYFISENRGEATELISRQIIHVPLFGDGLVGKSPISLARQSIGLGLATEGFGTSFFGNGAMPSGVLTHPGKMGDSAKNQLREAFDQRHRGVNQSNRVLLLEGGMTWTQVGVPPEDAQFLETRKFQVTDIARWYGVPVHMLGEMGRATWNNVEQLAIEFVTYTLRTYIIRIEEELNRKLLFNEPDLYVKFIVDALLRGDSVARFQQHEIAHRIGLSSINDILAMEDRNPLEGDEGEARFIPANMTTVEKVLQADLPEPTQQAEPAGTKQSGNGRAIIAIMVRDVSCRMALRETAHVRRAIATGDVDTMRDKICKFYRDHEESITRMLKPLAEALAAETGVVLDFAREASRLVASARRTLLDVLSKENPTRVLSEVLDAWEQHRAENLAAELLERYVDAHFETT